MNRPLVHVQPPYRRGDDVQVGDGLTALGAGGAMLIDEGALNRYTRITDVDWVDEDNSHPPAKKALVTIASRILRKSRANGMGPAPCHAILHVETLPALRDHVTAAQILRANLAGNNPVSIGVFPGWFTPADPAWADAERVVDALCWGLYPSNEVVRHGVGAWRDVVDAGAVQLRAWFPRRRKWIGYLTPFKQVWWADQPQYADIADQNWEAVPVAWWEEINLYIRSNPRWAPLLWGPCPPGRKRDVAEHVEIFCKIWGLKGTSDAHAI